MLHWPAMPDDFWDPRRRSLPGDILTIVRAVPAVLSISLFQSLARRIGLPELDRMTEAGGWLARHVPLGLVLACRSARMNGTMLLHLMLHTRRAAARIALALRRSALERLMRSRSHPRDLALAHSQLGLAEVATGSFRAEMLWRDGRVAESLGGPSGPRGPGTAIPRKFVQKRAARHQRTAGPRTHWPITANSRAWRKWRRTRTNSRSRSRKAPSPDLFSMQASSKRPSEWRTNPCAPCRTPIIPRRSELARRSP